jgi:lysophospholipase L1-like esterase
VEEYRNGAAYILPCLLTHKPLDLVIVMLGSNDMKRTFNITPFIITKGLGLLTDKIRWSRCGRSEVQPKILIVSPIHIGDNILSTDIAGYFDETAVEKSKELSVFYKELADANGFYFLDAAKYAGPSREDALHMTPEEHAKLASAAANKVKEIL